MTAAPMPPVPYSGPAHFRRYELLHADCRVVMANMGDNTVDSVVCDPPYHLTSIVKRFGPGCAPQQYGTDGAYARAARGFMGQTWDGGDIAFDPALWAEVWRVLKPGGHLLAFGGTRTYHRMAVAIEDAGFEIRDMFSWLYGSGFPKSHNVSKAIDKAAGVERDRTALWQGWGTAVKPAQEPICLARKPLVGSVAGNVLEWGTGALNIDGCRIGTGDDRTSGGNPSRADFSPGWGMAETQRATGGRFPANVMHDGSDAVMAIFPMKAGAAAPPSTTGSKSTSNTFGEYSNRSAVHHGDSGSAARFFYCAKASKRDRDEGCEHLQVHPAGMVNGSGRHLTKANDADKRPKRANIHPTVKPTDLMRYLCRLVTPPGGLVFDPFAGSGSTGKGALLEGFRFLGSEMTAEYIPIARARLEWALRQRG